MTNASVSSACQCDGLSNSCNAYYHRPKRRQTVLSSATGYAIRTNGQLGPTDALASPPNTEGSFPQ